MNFVYITGTGSGIGKALAERLLDTGKYKVIGISRHQRIEHPHYLHIALDLSKPRLFKKFRFEHISKAAKIVLVNNAATLGEVKHVGRVKPHSIVAGYHLNLVAPAFLSNEFLRSYRNHEAQKLIINISSGAAFAAIESWSVYCSSKAGLEMFSAVLEEELKMDGVSDTRVFSVSPGVVDTPMQARIREADPAEFHLLDQFKKYKEEGLLADPADVAARLENIIEFPGEYPSRTIRLDVDGRS